MKWISLKNELWSSEVTIRYICWSVQGGYCKWMRKWSPKREQLRNLNTRSASRLVPVMKPLWTTTRSLEVSTLTRDAFLLMLLSLFSSGSNHQQVCEVETFKCKEKKIRVRFCLPDDETLIWSLLTFHMWHASSGMDQLFLFRPPRCFTVDALKTEETFIPFHFHLLCTFIFKC